jgi:hypothetical protein
VLGQPRGHVGVLMGGVVIQDQMDGEPFGDLLVDRAQELAELLVPVPRQALPDHGAGVTAVTPTASAIRVFATPSAASNNARALRT